MYLKMEQKLRETFHLKKERAEKRKKGRQAGRKANLIASPSA